jgi:hypothetical protein
MSTFEFIGHITAEIFLLLQDRIKTRGIIESWNQFMAGFSNTIKIPCPMCQKLECWLPDVEQVAPAVKLNTKNSGQAHAK